MPYKKGAHDRCFKLLRDVREIIRARVSKDKYGQPFRLQYWMERPNKVYGGGRDFYHVEVWKTPYTHYGDPDSVTWIGFAHCGHEAKAMAFALYAAQWWVKRVDYRYDVPEAYKQYRRFGPRGVIENLETWQRSNNYGKPRKPRKKGR